MKRPYSKQKEAICRYQRANIHTVSLNYRNVEYDTIIKPAAEKLGMPVSTFIRLAVREKIDREGL